jgi:hypothetical protein
VRFDDSNLEQYLDAQKARKWRIPISMVTLLGTLRDAGPIGPGEVTSTRLRRDQLLRMKQEWEADGLGFEIVSHTRNNWTATPDTQTMADIDEQLRKDDIEALLGTEVRCFLQPGDATQLAWARKHRDLISNRLNAAGYHYAVGLSEDDGDLGGGQFSIATPQSVANMKIGVAAGGEMFKRSTGARPGLCQDPFALQGGYTIDLGSVVVSRGVKKVGGGEPDPDPISGSRGWILGENNTGAGADGDFAADWDKTWAFRYSSFLGFGLSFQVALHGENRTNETALTLTTSGNKVYPRHMDYNHVFATLRKLEDAGLIVLCTFYEWCQYLYSEPAPGFDYAFPGDYTIPHVAIGDLSQGHIVWPQGITAGCGGYNTFDNGGWAPLPADGDGDQLFDDVAGAELTAIMGPSVVGERGELGAIRLRPDESQASVTSANFTFAGLRPGFYRLRIPFYATSGNINVTNLALGAVRRLGRALSNADEATGLLAQREWEFSLQWANSDYRQLLLAPDAKWLSLDLPLHCPSDARPTLSAYLVHAAGLIGAGGTETFTIAVPGAKMGAAVRVTCAEVLQTGLQISGAVTDADEVTVTIHNTSAGGLTPPSSEYLAIVDDVRAATPPHPMDTLEAGRWSYTFKIAVGKDGLSEGVLGKVSLLYLGPDA